MSISAITAYSMPQVNVENRADWTPEPGRSVLLIHDMQYYFLEKYDMQAEPVPTLIRHIHQLRKLCHAQGIPVIYTAQPTAQPPHDRALLTDFWGPA